MTRDWVPNPTGKNSDRDKLRLAKFAAEAYGDPTEFKTRKEWLAALDESLTDLARRFGFAPSATILDTLEELAS